MLVVLLIIVVLMLVMLMLVTREMNTGDGPKAYAPNPNPITGGK